MTDATEAVEEASSVLSILGCTAYLRTLESRDALIGDASRAYIEGRLKEAVEQ